MRTRRSGSLAAADVNEDASGSEATHGEAEIGTGIFLLQTAVTH